jgi:hypothetical protein
MMHPSFICDGAMQNWLKMQPNKKLFSDEIKKTWETLEPGRWSRGGYIEN